MVITPVLRISGHSPPHRLWSACHVIFVSVPDGQAFSTGSGEMQGTDMRQVDVKGYGEFARETMICTCTSALPLDVAILIHRPGHVSAREINGHSRKRIPLKLERLFPSRKVLEGKYITLAPCSRNLQLRAVRVSLTPNPGPGQQPRRRSNLPLCDWPAIPILYCAGRGARYIARIQYIRRTDDLPSSPNFRI